MEKLKNLYQEAFVELPKLDPILGKVVVEKGMLEPIFQTNYFQALVQKIISQQLSVKAADSIRGRVEEMIDHQYIPTRLAKFSQEEYRSAGVSRQKFGYINDLCHHFIDQADFFDNLNDQADDEVLEKLTQIRGIGVWTAQMFLMFTLGRADIFAPDDVGLQNAIVKLYELEEKPKRKALEAFAVRWAPYRTVASRYLWRSLDGPAEV